MDILFVAIGDYDDPHALNWHADARYSVNFLRTHDLSVGYWALNQVSDLSIAKLASQTPGAVYVEISEENHPRTAAFLAGCREAMPGTTLLAGGIRASLEPHSVLTGLPMLDGIVQGERELILLEVVQRIRQGGTINGVAGVVTRTETGPKRALMPDLDALGEMIEDGAAEILAKSSAQTLTVALKSSRGCYGRCSFCGVPGFYRLSTGAAWRGRSAAAVVDEMQSLHDRFNVERFIFEDDNFIGPGAAGQQRARLIARTILARRLRLAFFICCRLNDLDRDTLLSLKDAGLSGLGVSIESADQDSLNRFRKGLRARDVHAKLRLIEECELPCEVNLIFFTPYLDLDGVRANLRLLTHVKDSPWLSYSDAFPFNELRPYSWAPISAMLRSDGLLDQETHSFRFQDAAVGQIARFVGRLRTKIPVTFKSRLPFDGLNTVALSGGQLDALDLMGRSLRHWVGLDLLPRYVRAACDELESGSAATTLLLLEEHFDRDIAVLHELKRSIEHTLGSCPSGWCSSVEQNRRHARPQLAPERAGGFAAVIGDFPVGSGCDTPTQPRNHR